MCTLSCEINDQVGGDHAYCTCDCHKGTLPAIPPSRERRKLEICRGCGANLKYTTAFENGNPVCDACDTPVDG